MPDPEPITPQRSIAGYDDRRRSFLAQRVREWREMGYPLRVEHEEWKFDEICPCWSGAHAALYLNAGKKEIAQANRWFEECPIDWKIDPDMRVCEVLASYCTFLSRPEFSDRARARITEVIEKEPGPRRVYAEPFAFHATENHAMMGHVWRLLGAQMRGDKEETRTITAAATTSVTAHFRKGWLEFASPCYVEKEIGSLLMLAQWAEDAELRRRARLCLDAVFAEYALLNLEQCFGSAAARVYGDDRDQPEVNHNSRRDASRDGTYSCGSLLFGHGEERFYGVLGSTLLATSDYQPHPALVHAAIDRQALGEFEFRSRKPGYGQSAINNVDDAVAGDAVFNARTYAYATPDFILASSREVNARYGMCRGGMLSNRLIARGSPRKVVIVELGREAVDLFQHRGILIGRGIDTAAYLAHREFEAMHETANAIFLRDPAVFVALRIVDGGYTWEGAKGPLLFGDYAHFQQGRSPFVLRAARPADYGGDFDAFRAEAEAARITQEGEWLTYRGDIAAGGGKRESVTVRFQPGRPPRLEGGPLDFDTYPLFESPYLNSAWDSGVVEMSVGEHHMRLALED